MATAVAPEEAVGLATVERVVAEQAGLLETGATVVVLGLQALLVEFTTGAAAEVAIGTTEVVLGLHALLVELTTGATLVTGTGSEETLLATGAAVLETIGAAADEEATGVVDSEEDPSQTFGPGMV